MTENKIEKTFQLECREDVEFCIDDVEYPKEVEYVDTPITVEFVAENNSLDKSGYLSSIILKRDGKKVWQEKYKEYKDAILKPGRRYSKTIMFNLLELGFTDSGIHDVRLEGVWYLFKNNRPIKGRIDATTLKIRVVKGSGVVIRNVDVAPRGPIEDADMERRICFKIRNINDRKIRITKTALLIGGRKIAEKYANTDLRSNQEYQDVYKIVPSEVGIIHKGEYDCKIEVVYECWS